MIMNPLLHCQGHTGLSAVSGALTPETADKGAANGWGGKAGTLSRPTASITPGLIMPLCPLCLPVVAW